MGPWRTIPKDIEMFYTNTLKVLRPREGLKHKVQNFVPDPLKDYEELMIMVRIIMMVRVMMMG